MSILAYFILNSVSTFYVISFYTPKRKKISLQLHLYFKSVRNRCVIEVFGGVCVCCPLVFEFSVGIGGFVIGLGQISFFFS